MLLKKLYQYPNTAQNGAATIRNIAFAILWF